MFVIYLSTEEIVWLRSLIKDQPSPHAEAIAQKLAVCSNPRASALRTHSVFSIPEVLLPNENETTTMLTLESIIVANVPGKGARLSKKLQTLLTSEVVWNGQTYPSPETLLATQSEFEAWVRERLDWLRTQPGASRERAVHLLRAYGMPHYGWLTWMKERGSLPLSSKIEVSFELD